uniref:Uncharacterized protein n=1 Tax=Tetranychus urticae TaxID=32264 RepID=T1KY07_TETUR
MDKKDRIYSSSPAIQLCLKVTIERTNWLAFPILDLDGTTSLRNIMNYEHKGETKRRLS